MSAGADLGTIVRACGAEVSCRRITRDQRKALRAIAACRTPAMGGRRQQCDRCGHEHIQWHSCRYRACPGCGASARAAWLAERESELLDAPYFHVVFTIPEELNDVALRHARVFYDLLLRAAGTTLIEIGLSRLSARLGALAVLHTWTQTLGLHPHVHCVVPGGGFSLDGRRWLRVKKRTFFLPVKVLSRRFRTNFCDALSQRLSGTVPELASLLARLRRKEWVVYCKPPFAGPSCVLRYLANYTHRIAISNSRILSFDGQRVTFRYRVSSRDNSHGTMTLDAGEFLRRFLLHVIPSRLVRIRYYGFLANRTRAASVAHARELIRSRTRSFPTAPVHPIPAKPRVCPRCGEGVLQPRSEVPPQPSWLAPSFEDSS